MDLIRFSQIENYQPAILGILFPWYSVAELAAKGLRNPETAQTLIISEKAVIHHLKIAFRKMNIDRRSRMIDTLR